MQKDAHTHALTGLRSKSAHNLREEVQDSEKAGVVGIGTGTVLWP